MTRDMLAHATFRFFGSANDFLPARHRNRDFSHGFRGTPSVKDRIETLGAPHTEVAHIRVDGHFCDFSRRLGGDEYVEVYSADARIARAPARALNDPPSGEVRFVVDVNLGRLARMLRLLGFNTLYRNDYDDAHVAAVAAAETRVLLTRDRRLLMRREVGCGYFVRSDAPREQVHEVLGRFGLEEETRPFYRCSRCNGLVHPVAKHAVVHLLEPKTKRYYDTFWQCGDCGQVYWEGSHMAGLVGLVEQLGNMVLRDRG